MEPKLAPAGDRGALIELGSVSVEELHAAASRVRGARGVLGCIVGQQSLYVVCDCQLDGDDLLARVHSVAEAPPLESRVHALKVSFASEQALDLENFLTMHGVTRSEFFERVGSLRLVVRYLGFRAGFPYLDGWPGEWAMPRRSTSRPLVPRGSFAIANEVAGFYPIDSPGGWNILGRTPARLWDPTRVPPNLLRAGDEVRIVPVGTSVDSPPVPEERAASLPDVDVESGGPWSAVVTRRDWKRIEYGLSPGGPFDEELAAIANRTVGNEPDAPVLECALVGPRLRFRKDRIVAWFGAECDLPRARPLTVSAGAEIGVGRIRGGMRGYLAVGAAACTFGEIDRGRRDVVRAVAGPHETPLREIECEVTPQLNRIGIRLRPLRPISFDPPADLPSSGMQLGTIQLHPDGSLVAMGPDHPITGGYLQVMTVQWEERWKLAHLAPGEGVVLTTLSSD